MLTLTPKHFLIFLLCLSTSSNLVDSISFSSQTSLQSSEFTLSSPVFAPGAFIPVEYSSYGANINPPLSWDSSALPPGTQSLAIVIDDPDAPSGLFTHWLVKNIPITTTNVAANSTPGVTVVNSWGDSEYGGPQPPNGTHRYFFQLYAMPNENMNAKNKWSFYDEVRGNAIGAAVLMGRYTAPTNSSSSTADTY